MKLKDKVAVISGGSRGIGKAIAKAYLKEGAKLVLVARGVLELEATVQELKNSGTKETNQVIGVLADVARIEDVKKLMEKTLTCYGTVDILVNAAGVQSPIGKLVEVDAEEWIHNICINLTGTMLCCKYVLPVMIQKKEGKIINFSGGGGTSPRPHFSAYASSKAAIVRFTETLAMEVKNHKIDVNAIAPGPVNTKMLKEIIEAQDKSGEKELLAALEREKKGGISPEVPGALAVFLASKGSDGLSGRLISAVWDDWKNFSENIDKIMASSLFTLRRIDGKNFLEKNL